MAYPTPNDILPMISTNVPVGATSSPESSTSTIPRKILGSLARTFSVTASITPNALSRNITTPSPVPSSGRNQALGKYPFSTSSTPLADPTATWGTYSTSSPIAASTTGNNTSAERLPTVPLVTATQNTVWTQSSTSTFTIHISARSTGISTIASSVSTAVPGGFRLSARADSRGTASVTGTPSKPSCVITSSTPAPSESGFGLVGVKTYCQCGALLADINFAVSSNTTTSYCALGEPAPTGFTQVPSYNDHPEEEILASSASASAASVASAAAAKCTDGRIPDESCFNELDLPDYIVHWWSANEANCSTLQFADCFYALETRYAPSVCGELHSTAICSQPLWTDFEGKPNGVQNFYVAFNIWNINGFFLDVWNAIGNARGSCSAGIGDIVNVLNPVVHPNQVLQDVLLALSFGLALYAEGGIIAKALFRAIPQSIVLGEKLHPAGTVEGQWDDWKDVQANVGLITDAFQASVASAVPELLHNVTAFIQFSQSSGLSGYRPSLDGLSDSFTQAFNTYIISRVMALSGWVISRSPNTDVHALQTNGTKLRWNTNCGGGYDASGVCDSFFYDGTDTYGLTDSGNWAHNQNNVLSHFLNGSKPMTTGKLLFTGGQQCYQASGKNGGNAPTIDLANPTDFNCLSNLRVCTWNATGLGPFDNSCPPDPQGSTPELHRYGFATCNGGNYRFGRMGPMVLAVPRVYLGPGVKDDNGNEAELKRYKFCNNYNAGN